VKKREEMKPIGRESAGQGEFSEQNEKGSWTSMCSCSEGGTAKWCGEGWKVEIQE
jgi:hypothetical protein